MVDVHGPEILIYVHGTCLKMTCQKGDAPWLDCTELRADDPEAIFTRDEFKALPLTTPNAKPRELGWIIQAVDVQPLAADRALSELAELAYRGGTARAHCSHGHFRA